MNHDRSLEDPKSTAEIPPWRIDDGSAVTNRYLKERLYFETLISGFSSAFIHLPSAEIESELRVWLRRFVRFLKVDLAMVLAITEDHKRAVVVQFYLDPSSGLSDISNIIQKETVPQLVFDRLLQGKIQVVTNIHADLTKEERQTPIVKNGAKSFVSIPLVSGDIVLGDLVFAIHRHAKQWPESLVQRLKLIGEIITNVLLRRRTQNALIMEMAHRQRLEQRYATILKTANVGFWISDLNQNILEVNDTACHIAGYSREEFCSKKVLDLDVLNTPDDIEKIRHELRTAGHVRHLARHRRKDGSMVDLAVSSTYSVQEGIVFAFFRDITELNRTQSELEERLRFEELLSDFSAALVTLTQKESMRGLGPWIERIAQFLNVDFCTVNEYVEGLKKRRRIYSYTRPGFEKVALVVPETIHEMPMFGFSYYIKNGTYLKFNRIPDDIPQDFDSAFIDRMMKDGTKSLLAMPLIVGQLIYGAIVFASFTIENLWTEAIVRRLGLVAEMLANALLRDQSKQELTRYRTRLEQIIEERTAALKAAQHDLIQSERLAALGKLTAVVGHELRNPLGTIGSSLYSISQRLVNRDSKTADAIERAERNLERCDRIIEELLDFTRTRDLDQEPTLIDSWIEALLSDLPPPSGIRVEKQLNANILLNLDRERFRRCLINLLSNAYQAIELRKDSLETGLVTVTTQVRADRLEITIADNGVGFEPEQGDRIGEPLFSTKNFGVGLGVPIAKRIVEQHGGVLLLHGQPGQGATVILSLPCKTKKE